MIRLSEEEFKQKKTSDTIFVLGSGWSINKVTDEQWNIISKHNSVAFNWFCKHSFEPSFFLIREQANIPSRKGPGESIKKLIKSVNRYKNTYGIICDVSHHTKKAYRYRKDKRIQLKCILVSDDNKKRHGRKLKTYMRRNPFQSGLVHGTCTMYNIMHLVKYLEYKTVVFVGVDLTDSRYFWLGRKETRHSVAKKGKSWKNKHSVMRDVLELVKKFKKFNIPMYVANPKSKLTKYIRYRSIDEFK